MKSKVLQNIFYKIQVSECYSGLEQMNEQYATGNKDEYLIKMEDLYSDLQRLHCDDRGLFSKMAQLLKNRDAAGVYLIADDIRNLLDSLYYKTSSGRVFPKKTMLIALSLVLVVLFAVLYSPLKAKYYNERDEYLQLVNEDAIKQKTLIDIVQLKAALENYYRANRAYPLSSGGWDAVIANYGESKQDYIPGLAPKYIAKLPADPRNSKDPGKQYMYKSDGKDFKLIAHHPVGIEEVIKNHSEMVDPVRPSWAFGVWSKGAENW